jgi:uncharacterized protein YjbJ (UPF0337 family)
MPTATKINPKKTEATKQKLTDNQVAKTASDLFAKIKAKTGASSKKVDEWQKTWLAMPKTRKKYEHLIDAPEIVGEEMLGMTNDIIQFIQREEGGDSIIFKKIKGEWGEVTHHPVDYFKGKWEKGKSAVQSATGKIKAGIEKAKGGVAKAKKVAGKAKSTAKKVKKITKK